MTNLALKSPFPYFGGKSRIASAAWERFGDVPNYVTGERAYRQHQPGARLVLAKLSSRGPATTAVRGSHRGVVMRIYISGPITGRPDYREEFGRAERELRRRGHRVVNPARSLQPGWTWHDYIRRDLRWLAICSGICLLPGWQHSAGARIELAHAISWGLGVMR